MFVTLGTLVSLACVLLMLRMEATYEPVPTRVGGKCRVGRPEASRRKAREQQSTE